MEEEDIEGLEESEGGGGAMRGGGGGGGGGKRSVRRRTGYGTGEAAKAQSPASQGQSLQFKLGLTSNRHAHT